MPHNSAQAAATSEVPIGRQARELLSRAKALHRQAATAAHSLVEARQRVEHAYGELREEMVRRELSTIPVGRLRESTDGRVRLGSLEKAGYTTVLKVLDSSPSRLQQLPGVGQQTATQAVAAARQVAAAVRDGMKVRVDLDPTNPRSTALITALARLESTQRTLVGLDTDLPRLDQALAAAVKMASPTRGRVRMLLTRSARKDDATRALAEVQDVLAWADGSSVTSTLNAAQHIAGPPLPDDVWADFAQRAPDYYGVLGQVVDLGLDVAAAEGFLPAEIVAQVNEQQLDEPSARCPCAATSPSAPGSPSSNAA